jgi:hypothetical protein
MKYRQVLNILDYAGAINFKIYDCDGSFMLYFSLQSFISVKF